MCIYELWLIDGCIDRPIAEELHGWKDGWIDRSIDRLILHQHFSVILLYISWYYSNIIYIDWWLILNRYYVQLLVYTDWLHIMCYTQKETHRFFLPCLIQDFVNRYKMPAKSRSTICWSESLFFHPSICPWAIKRGNGKYPICRWFSQLACPFGSGEFPAGHVWVPKGIWDDDLAWYPLIDWNLQQMLILYPVQFQKNRWLCPTWLETCDALLVAAGCRILFTGLFWSHRGILLCQDLGSMRLSKDRRLPGEERK